MKKLKTVFLSTIFMVLGIGIIFFLELILNEKQIKQLIVLRFLIILVLVIFTFMQMTNKKDKEKKFFKNRIEGFIFICIISIIGIGSGYLSVYNIAVYEVFGNNLNFSEKIEKFKGLKSSIESKKEYDKEIYSYIEDLNKEKIDYIEIYYDNKIKMEYIEIIKATIPVVEKLTDNIYGNLERAPLKVIFYSDIDKFKMDGFESELVQGFYDGENIHIKDFQEDQPLWHVEDNFIHEYAHYAFRNYLYQREIVKPPPSWFDEGIAEYIAAYEEGREYSLEYLRNPIDLRELYTSEDFMKSFGSEMGTEDFYDPYMYSYYMIDSLVDLKGEGFITAIILKSKEIDFYQVFEEIVGVSIEEYQEVNLIEYINMMREISNI